MAEHDYASPQAKRGILDRDQATPMPGRQTLVGRDDVSTAPPGGKTSYASASGTWARGVAQAQDTQLAVGAQASAPAVANTAAPSGSAAAIASPAPDVKTIARAIITGYQAAQHELDKSGAPDDVLKHLLHVGNLSPDYRNKVDFDAVWAAADSFEQALRSRSQKTPAKYQRVVDINKRIRDDIGLTGASKPQLDHSGGSDASYAKAAIGPAFDALAIHVRDALKTLDDTDSYDHAARVRIVERIAGEIRFSSDYLAGLLETIPSDERRSFASAAKSAAVAVGRALRWVRTRPTHEQLEAKLLRGVGAFDGVLMSIGTEPIGERDAVVLTENQQSHADEEKAEFKKAMDATVHAIEQFQRDVTRRIELFQNIANLDDQPQPDFKKSLMKAIIEATLLAIVGHLAKVLATAHLPTAARTGSSPPPAREHGAESDTESVYEAGLESLKNAAAAQLEAEPKEKVDPRKLALYYFCSSLKAAEATRADAYVGNLRAAEARSAISLSQLRDIKHVIDVQKKTLVEHEMEIATKAWAQYMAQSRLGAKTIGHDRVSNMREYFGEERPGGRAFGTSKAGGDGILSVTMHVDRGKPTLDPSATKVIGLNSELQSHLFTAANNEFDLVQLPKEVHVGARFARATIALDEKNRIRDVLNWDEVQRHVGGMTASSFWHTWGRNLKVS